MQSWTEVHNARHFSLLRDPGEMGRLSGETAVSFLGASSIPKREMPVVFDRYVSGSIPSHLVQAILGENIHQGRSFFRRQSLDTEVFSPFVSIVSDPLIPRLLGSHPFDGEGIAGTRRELVSGGVLKSFVANLRSAAKLGIAPTGSVGNLYMENGNVSREALIAGINRGFLVMEFLGQGPNITTGDYSRGASGFLIENGKITRPVNGVTIAGNLRNMFAKIVPANDMVLGRFNAPTLRIDGMMVAGKKV
jgi:PmbA protein